MATGRFGILLAAFATACTTSAVPSGSPSSASTPLMSPAQFQALPSQPADHRIAYGEDPDQYGELKLPQSPGPHPVVVLVHGGCLQKAYATLRDLAPLADALKADGIATWNIEYRRRPSPGSGWPGTYLDVGLAIDHLRAIAAPHRLDLGNVVVLGHSAGGHLAMWAAARARLPASSPLYASDPLPIRGVINLAGYGDIEAFRDVELTACRRPVVADLLGGEPADVPERYSQTSAAKMLPLGIPQVLIWGARDDMTTVRLGERYTKAASLAGDTVRLEILPALGHFEIANPESDAWPVVREAVRSQLQSHD